LAKFVVLPIEVKVRDFQSRLFLALELCRSGFEVIIGSQSTIQNHVKNLPKGIYFDKSLSKNKLNFFKELKSSGFKLVSQDEEGLCGLFNYERYITQRVCAETLALADAVFTWGNSEARLIKDRYPEFKEKVSVTGNPRIDMLLNPNKELYQKQANKYMEELGPYLLFPSSFTVNHAMGSENMDSFLINMGRVESRQDLESYHKRQDFFKKTFLLYSELVEKTAIRYKHMNIVVRPHPSEDAEHWINIAKKFNNIQVRTQGNVASWILGSKAVIHSSCTTGMEAFILKKPVISFLPFTDHEYAKQISNTVSKICKDSTKVFEALDGLFKENQLKNYSAEDSKNFLLEHIDNLEGIFSIEKITSEILKININDGMLIQLNQPLYIKIKKTLILLREHIFNPKGLQYSKQKFPGISFKELNENIQNLKFNMKDKTTFNCKQIAKDLFLISA